MSASYDDPDDDHGWPDSDFEEEEYENLNPADNAESASLTSRTVPPPPLTCKTPTLPPRGPIALVDQLRDVAKQQSSKINTANSRQLPPPPPPTERRGSNNLLRPVKLDTPCDDITYEESDDVRSSVKTNRAPSPARPGKRSAVPTPIPRAAEQPRAQRLCPPPPESNDDDVYETCDEYPSAHSSSKNVPVNNKRGISPQPAVRARSPAPPPINSRAPPLPPVSSRPLAFPPTASPAGYRSPVPPPVPDYDDEYTTVDDPPNKTALAGLPQNRPSASLPRNVGISTERFTPFPVTDTSTDDIEYEAGDFYHSSSKPSQPAFSSPVFPNRSNLHSRQRQPERAVGSKPNRSNSNAERNRPMQLHEHAANGLKHSESDVMHNRFKREPYPGQHPGLENAEGDGKINDSQGSVNSSMLLQIKGRLKSNSSLSVPEQAPVSSNTRKVCPVRPPDTPPSRPAAMAPPDVRKTSLTPNSSTDMKFNQPLQPPARPAARSPVDPTRNEKNVIPKPAMIGNSSIPVDGMASMKIDLPPKKESRTPGSGPAPTRLQTAREQSNSVQPRAAIPLPPVNVEVEEEGLYRFPWYFGSISRKESEIKLRQVAQDGAFMIRRSQGGDSSGHPYSISIFYRDYVYNLQLRKRSDQKYAIGTQKIDECTFCTLQEFVAHYKKNVLELLGDERRNIASGKVLLKSVTIPH